MNDAPDSGPLRSLPSWAEMAIVIVLAFGLFIYSSTFYAMAPDTAVTSNAADYRLLMMLELIQGALIVGFLWARGWALVNFGVVSPRWRDVRDGAALLVVVCLFSWAAYYTAIAFRPELEPVTIDIDERGVPPALALAFSIVNAGYEELFVCAYVVAAWRGNDFWTAIAISSILRLSYHLYQGPLVVATIFPLGLLFAWYFAKHRRVLPLVLVHAALDLIAFWQGSA